ncbi:uncharacterized protein LOC143753424 [Siphateles boraxobius]|uniref:uncharacterized protein LOC143753424 n=1 Tax=Siphateles boraxobius TaxID=180520 RepID=UPI004062C079
MAEKEKLIQTVFARPLLYNASLRGYRCSERRVGAWREIAASVGLSVVQCKLKREDLHYWPHRENLSFLDNPIRKRKIPSEAEAPEDHTHTRLSEDHTHTRLSEDHTHIRLSEDHTHIRLSENEPLKSVQKALDEDELFLLSFVPALKRLTPQKRAAVKMQIQKIMFDAEFKDP